MKTHEVSDEKGNSVVYRDSDDNSHQNMHDSGFLESISCIHILGALIILVSILLLILKG